MNDEQEKALQKLSDLGQEMEKAQAEYDAYNDNWWNGLTEAQREDAFYAVCKRLYEGEIKVHGTYRYVLYDVFGFDGGMYVRGMNCGFMALHNAIFDGEEMEAMKGITRLEVIGPQQRDFVKYLDSDERVRYILQDDNRTLKIFIDKVTQMKVDF